MYSTSSNELKAIEQFITFCNEQEKLHDTSSKLQEKLEEYKKVFLKQNTVFVFTDGSCCGNGKIHSTAGIGIYIPSLEVKISESLNTALSSVCIQNSKNTNQRAELAAILKVLDILSKSNALIEDVSSNIEIYSDSMYSINCVTKWYKAWEKNGWLNSTSKPVVNRDIIEPIIDILKKSNNVKFCYVRAHTKEPPITSSEYFLWNGNDTADKLATDGSKLKN
jgi:ribonuclease HI